MTDKWIVNVLGSTRWGYEMSAVRASNTHGIASYGWTDNGKVIIASSEDRTMPFIFRKLKKLTQEVVDKLNAEEA